MQSILLVLQPPTATDRSRNSEWTHVCELLATKSRQTGGADVLAAGVLLLRSSDALPILGEGIHLAGEYHLSYRVLFVESATEWSPTPPAA
jgi:hypothetical protein